MKINKTVILAFHVDKIQKEKLQKAAEFLGVSLHLVPEEQENAPIGMLAGAEGIHPSAGSAMGNALNGRFGTGILAPIQGIPVQGIHAGGPQTGMPLTEPMLVMALSNKRQLDPVLAALRSAHTGIDLKAVLTETNASWSARQLAGELRKERSYMKQRK